MRGPCLSAGESQLNMAKRQIAIFAFIGLIWGSEWIAMSAMDAPPLRILAFRYAVAALTLGAVVLTHRIQLQNARRLWIAASTGVGLLVIPSILLTWGSSRISPGLLVVVLALTPLIAALFEGRASGVLLSALIGGVGGTALIASQALSFGWTQWAGATAILIAAVSVAASVVTIKRELLEISPIVLAAIQLAAGATLMGGASLAFERHAYSRIIPRAIALEIAMALVANVVAYPLYYSLFRSMESFQLTALQWLSTVAGLTEGLVVVKELPSGRIIAGAGLLLVSLLVLLRTRATDDEPPTLLHNA